MLSKEEQMEVLEAYDLTRSYRATAQLCGVDHHTVARVVAERATGCAGTSAIRPKRSDAYADKIEEWIDKSTGKVRADVVHERLVAMGYEGSERTTRRVVAALKAAWRREHHRVYKPWIPEPGLWLQYDFGTGPKVQGEKTLLFCAWLAWSRFRVILALHDRKMPSVIAAIDQTLRTIGGAPTYLLTDNEKTVTDRHIAGIAVRNPMALNLGHYYGCGLVTCVPYDPESKGGSEATVRVAKADLVPTEANLLDEYSRFAELEEACRIETEVLNTRPHGVTRRVPEEMLAIEREHLHQIPDLPYVAAFGESRSVGWSSTVSFGGARYSVPDALCESRVWVRRQGDEVVVVAGAGSGAREVARHRQVPPGHASINDEHYTRRPAALPVRTPKATNELEERFLALGEGASRYLVEAAASGARRIEARMQEAVTLGALHGAPALDEALGLAAFAGRFQEGDLESILVHARGAQPGALTPPTEHSLARGTAAWSAFKTGEEPR